jgi:excisionase family DNA binding protein
MTESNTDPSDIEQRMTVGEAADAMGISSEAVRTRIQRGTLRSVREGGRVFVLFDRDMTQPNTDRTDAQTELVDELRARVAFLEAELKIRTEENRRKDHLLAAALERIPAIEPPAETRESPETVEGEPERAESRPAKGEVQEGVQRSTGRSLWRRMFGG